MAVADGWVRMTNWLAAAGLTSRLFDGPTVRPSPEKLNATVPAVSSARPVKVAKPPFMVAVAPASRADPVLGEAVITVLLSLVSRFPYRILLVDDGLSG